MILNNKALLSVKGGIGMFKAIDMAINRIARAFRIRYLMHILFVD